VLDLLLGDPAWLTPIHPVVLMGKMITALEKLLRRVFPKTDRGEEAAGAVLALLMTAGTYTLCKLILRVLDRLCLPFSFALEIIWCWQALAMCCLRKESENVRRKLVSGTLAEARKAVGRIVGRDTAELSDAGVTRAAVETVAENFSDGEIAPLFYMLIGGAPLALAYKAVNTMDSMVGYKNEDYIDFGRAAAKLDDAANILPSRLAAILLIAAAPLVGLDGKNALRIWRRDRRKHASPNSAQTEAAMAGALHVQLAGPASYFGERVEKPYIGDERRKAEPEDIRRSNRLMFMTEAVVFVLCMAVMVTVLCCMWV
jgi:adenosylcobinamide-phosphate synthase